jgi:hypothetical protein
LQQAGSWPPQTTPQPPQLFLSLEKSLQPPPQQPGVVWPLQTLPHAPQLFTSPGVPLRLVHFSSQQTGVPPAQTLLHCPQLAGSELKSLQVLLQQPGTTCWWQVAPQLPQLLGSSDRSWQEWLQQAGWAPVQASEQAPQSLMVPSVTQAAELPVPQTAWPLAQAPVQLPFWHSSPLPQVVPQAPQFLLSLKGFTHEPLQRVDGAAQVFSQTPRVQVWPPLQAMPQPPQLLLSSLVLAQ